MTFAEAGTHGLRTDGQLPVHHGGWKMGHGRERARTGGREVRTGGGRARGAQRSEELRQRDSKSRCQRIHWLTCLYRRRESDTERERERERE